MINTPDLYDILRIDPFWHSPEWRGAILFLYEQRIYEFSNTVDMVFKVIVLEGKHKDTTNHTLTWRVGNSYTHFTIISPNDAEYHRMVEKYPRLIGAYIDS